MTNVYVGAGAKLLLWSGVTIRKWRSNLTGTAYVTSPDWEIEAPVPTTARRFAVLAHEVAHQILHRGSRRPRWREEVEAWEWALAQFDRYGLPGKDDATKDAVQAIDYALSKALRRSRHRRLELAREMMDAYPEWWDRAEAFEMQAMMNPEHSPERALLDL